MMLRAAAKPRAAAQFIPCMICRWRECYSSTTMIEGARLSAADTASSAARAPGGQLRAPASFRLYTPPNAAMMPSFLPMPLGQ